VEQIEVRAYEESDRPAIEEILGQGLVEQQRLVSQWGAQINVPVQPDYGRTQLECYRRRLDGHPGRWRVATLRERVVGVMYLILNATDAPSIAPHAAVLEIDVREGFRSNGVGSRLMAEAEAIARGAQQTGIIASYNPANEASRRLCARHGYQVLEKRQTNVVVGKELAQ
jgi:GNAT superfamily N-acetyltransferase